MFGFYLVFSIYPRRILGPASPFHKTCNPPNPDTVNTPRLSALPFHNPALLRAPAQSLPGVCVREREAGRRVPASMFRTLVPAP